MKDVTTATVTSVPAAAIEQLLFVAVAVASPVAGHRAGWPTSAIA